MRTLIHIDTTINYTENVDTCITVIVLTGLFNIGSYHIAIVTIAWCNNGFKGISNRATTIRHLDIITQKLITLQLKFLNKLKNSTLRFSSNSYRENSKPHYKKNVMSYNRWAGTQKYYIENLLNLVWLNGCKSSKAIIELVSCLYLFWLFTNYRPCSGSLELRYNRAYAVECIYMRVLGLNTKI
ncbi:hypothetical protein AGLY_016199 [Aphis glycines]|uniref:Uncharacterized protein n=1 Tax=Aphis glycines TaxID=307491 RepID=A0A6G0T166_APHGL|nr:hypothetical protein AGLY_016199 [Aphis glycines]